ncbi:hypothetical protein J4227_03335 [Candidatus Woesearchaeota archaeon]|nr:hypothetical protein [Candidatus Woesearchaeota archaeon]
MAYKPVLVRGMPRHSAVNFGKFVVLLIIALPVFCLLFRQNYTSLLYYVLGIIILEILMQVFVNYLRGKFPWMITAKDELPEINPKGLDSFMKHGFDAELGWIRKPNTSKEEKGKEGTSKYHIGANGARKNPGYEKKPLKISVYGDSFAFARQVNDNQTWEWHLSKLTKSNVLNLGVGNYGLDQSIIRMKRDYPSSRTPVVIIGVVPSTIVRVLCIWKHYNEFGNALAFKPMFVLGGKKPRLVPNIMTSREKILSLEGHLDYFQKNDYFYKAKFRKEMISFPYTMSFFGNPLRNIPLALLILWSEFFESAEQKAKQVYSTPMKVIMDINLELRYALYTKNDYAPELMRQLVVKEFADYAKRMKFRPVFLMLPQKDDVAFVRKHGNYYAEFIKSISGNVVAIDLTDSLLKARDIDSLYSDDNQYGGHYSKKGNKFVAEHVYSALKDAKLF